MQEQIMLTIAVVCTVAIVALLYVLHCTIHELASVKRAALSGLQPPQHPNCRCVFIGEKAPTISSGGFSIAECVVGLERVSAILNADNEKRTSPMPKDTKDDAVAATDSQREYTNHEIRNSRHSIRHTLELIAAKGQSQEPDHWAFREWARKIASEAIAMDKEELTNGQA